MFQTFPHISGVCSINQLCFLSFCLAVSEPLFQSPPSPPSASLVLPHPCHMEVLLSEPDARQFLMNPLSECNSNRRAASKNINTSCLPWLCPFLHLPPSFSHPSFLLIYKSSVSFSCTFLSQKPLFITLTTFTCKIV